MEELSSSKLFVCCSYEEAGHAMTTLFPCSSFGSLMIIIIIITIIIIIIKRGRQYKAEREWCTPYQS